jgi:hypothetical protein
MIEIPVISIPIILVVGGIVSVLLIWSVQVNNRRWRAIAGALGGDLEIYSGLALHRQIRASYDGVPVEIKEASATRNTLPGTSVKAYVPMGFHLRVWPKGSVVLYAHLQRIAGTTTLDDQFDIFGKFDLYTDNADRATALLSDRTKRLVIKEFASRGGFEITPNYIQCVLRDRSIPDDPLLRADPATTHHRLLSSIQLLTSLGSGRPSRR